MVMPCAVAVTLVAEEQPQSSTPVVPAVTAAKAVWPAPAAPSRIQGVSVLWLAPGATPTLTGLYVIVITGLAVATPPRAPGAPANRIEFTNLEFAPVPPDAAFQLKVTLPISSSEDTPSAAIDVLAGSTRPRPSVMRVRTM